MFVFFPILISLYFVSYLIIKSGKQILCALDCFPVLGESQSQAMTKKISCYIFALISKINYFIGFLIEIPAAFFNQISNIFYGFRIISDQRAKPPTIYSSFLFRFQFCIHWILHKDLCLLFSSFSSFMVFIRPQSNKNRLFFGLKTNMFFLTLLVLFHVFQQKRKERSVFFHASTLI